MKILVTGGAGYIGSHTLLEILKEEHEALVLDNYCNASPESLSRVKRLANHDFDVVEGDIRDGETLNQVFTNFKPDTVIHFAGLKAVGESVEMPLNYYESNVYGSIQLLRAMEQSGCRKIVFSSTATVYGIPKYLPYDENHPLAPENPYGQSKLMVENITRDWTNANSKSSAVLLRYFNPVGAHDSGDIGEDPFGYPNNLMPFIQQVAVGRRKELTVHGNDYDTPDGTGVRDYIHIEDLAQAHLAAIKYCNNNPGTHVFNIGTGQGYSVLEMIKSFQQASNKNIPYKIGPRRIGDVSESVANPTKAKNEMNWQARFGLDEMCQTAWNFQSQNPKGYKK